MHTGAGIGIDISRTRAVTGSAVDACAAFHRQHGGRFMLRFKRRLVPMVLRRVELQTQVFYVFQIAYTIRETTAFTGMRLQIGLTSDQTGYTPYDAYIANIHALPDDHWKGSDMIELALAIARMLGVRWASLYDATRRVCEQGTDDAAYDLSMVMLLSRQVTFYGRYGFRPYADSLWDHGRLMTGEIDKDLCAALGALARVRTASLKVYLRSMLRRLEEPDAEFRLVQHLHAYGVLQIDLLSARDLKDTRPRRVALMKRLSEAFKGHRGLLFPLFEGDTLPCSVKSDFLELLGMGYPVLKPKKGPDVQWPAWVPLSQVGHIRRLHMHTIVHADPKMQRQTTLCSQAIA